MGIEINQFFYLWHKIRPLKNFLFLISILSLNFAFSQTFDTTNFNSANGRLNFDENNDIQFGNRVLERTDGSLILSGRTGSSSNIANTPILFCINEDGTTCSNFGNSGKIVLSTIPLSGTYDQSIQDDDKIIILGKFNNDLRVMRINNTGALDTSFAGNGILDIPVPSDAVGSAGSGRVYALKNNMGIVAIRNYSYATSPFRYKSAVYKIANDGTLDNSFGNQGELLLEYNGYTSFCNDFKEINNEYYFLSSGTPASGSGFITQLEKTDLTGITSSNFASSGVLEISNASLGSSMDIRGNIIALCGNSSGSGQSSLEIGVFNLDGSINTSFSSTGLQYFRPFNNNQDRGRDIIIQPDGKLLVLFETRITTVGEDGAMLRLLSDGTLDSTFNDSTSASPPGVFSLEIGGGNNEKNEMLLKDNGDLYVTGYANFFTPTRFDITVSKLIITDAALSQNDTARDNVTYYPNPTTSLITIKTQGTISFYSILNNLGQEVQKGNFPTSAQLDIQRLSKGLYYLQLNGGEQTQSFKFIKQ